MARLAEYVAKQIDWLLGEEDARQVRLLDDGMSAAAVARYFEGVGTRWEKERLHVEIVHTDITGSPEGTS